MKDLVFTRSHLLAQCWAQSIEDIQLTSFSAYKGFLQNWYQANSVIFLERNGSYKVLKDRYGIENTIYKMNNVICPKCRARFKAFTPEIISCINCEYTATYTNWIFVV